MENEAIGRGIGFIAGRGSLPLLLMLMLRLWLILLLLLIVGLCSLVVFY